MVRTAPGVAGLAIAALAATVLLPARDASAQNSDSRVLADAAELIQAFTSDPDNSIPLDLLERARGIAVVPNVFRGGFILGGRRGRGVLVVRNEDETWSNPAFVTLTGGSIGWQIGAESTDLVLVFANENSVKNIHSGKFTLGGDASAVAGPLGRHATMAMTFRAEVYSYVKSRGLFAGATFEGARLDVDQTAGYRFYSSNARAEPLGPQNDATPPEAQRFLLTLEQASVAPQAPADALPAAEEARTFPLGE